MPYAFAMDGHNSPRVTRLQLNEEEAKLLGTTAGPLTVRRLTECLFQYGLGRSASLAQRKWPRLRPRLRTFGRRASTAPRCRWSSELGAKLAALYTVLLPSSIRDAISAKKVELLLIVPDGPLALLPFEALVANNHMTPQYLLEVGPPVAYCPSATIVRNLIRRGPTSGPGDRRSVFTVGNPLYADASPTHVVSESSILESVSPRSRFNGPSGRLKRLPHSGRESAWFAESFRDSHYEIKQLIGARATESAVRNAAAGCRVVHFACHGLVDEEFGNFFGALALTPGPRALNDPSDDGFLTLSEIYELKLKGCELAILSACETNDGPRQTGEGVWALSRGFLVAGARRVVASNWLVDDEAAANLVRQFCVEVSKAEKAGDRIHYAQCLQCANALSASSRAGALPDYWATFVLIGPD